MTDTNTSVQDVQEEKTDAAAPVTTEPAAEVEENTTAASEAPAAEAQAEEKKAE